MFVNAILLIQNMQLAAFAVIFGFVAMQHWDDGPRRWLWYSFLINTVGAVLDFTAGHLPNWARHGMYLEVIPLSDAAVNTAVVYFLCAFRRSQWLAWGMAAAVLPVFLLWSGDPSQVKNGALQDLVIALEGLVTGVILVRSRESSTVIPRWVLSGFLFAYTGVGLARAFVAFVMGGDPDAVQHSLAMSSIVAWTLDTSLLPLGFIWMMNSRLEADLRRQALVDPLTQVLNRRGVWIELERELARSGRSGEPLTVVVTDLDRFKKWNDTYGHASGDAVLSAFATLLRTSLRKTDVLGRVGGEEFVILLPQTDAVTAEPMLERLCAAVARIEIADGLQSSTKDARDGATVDRKVTASFGATVVQRGGNTPAAPAALVDQADQALYEAKRDGRNCVRFYNASTTAEILDPSGQRWHEELGAAKPEMAGSATVPLPSLAGNV